MEEVIKTLIVPTYIVSMFCIGVYFKNQEDVTKNSNNQESNLGE